MTSGLGSSRSSPTPDPILDAEGPAAGPAVPTGSGAPSPEIWESQRTSFGADQAGAQTYDTYRPDWPAPTAAWLAGIEPGGPLAARSAAAGLDVVDLGAGTGKLTRTLAEAGHRVTAVEPSAGMLAVLAAALPSVRAVSGRSEEIPLPDGSADVITIAQAWHWMDPEPTAAECARILRPGGLLAVAWHFRIVEPGGWGEELQHLLWGQDVADDPSVHSDSRPVHLPAAFGPLQTTTFDYGLTLSPEGLVGVASSWSWVAVRPDRDQVLAQVAALGRRAAGPDGTLTLPYVTRCHRAARLG